MPVTSLRAFRRTFNCFQSYSNKGSYSTTRRHLQSKLVISGTNNHRDEGLLTKDQQPQVDGIKNIPIVDFLFDKCIAYNSYIYDNKLKIRFPNKKILERVISYIERETKMAKARSSILMRKKFGTNYLQVEHQHLENKKVLLGNTKTSIANYPYSQYSDIQTSVSHVDSNLSEIEIDYTKLPKIDIRDDMAVRLQQYDEGKLEPVKLKTPPYSDARTEVRSGNIENAVRAVGQTMYEEPSLDLKQFGTSDSSIPVSSVPCGGCGALLHCQDPSLPGFKPREVFVGMPNSILRASVCQRCYFLSNYNIALQVRVAPELYLDLLQPIKTQFAMVLLLVDLTDAPCSIHPNIIDVIAKGQPVILVGNKVDLMPMDGRDCLNRLEVALSDVVRRTALASANIVQTCLVSGHTGFGVEELISSIHYHWENRGDIFLVGCTNVGKSTLFNALLQSDLCNSKASNLLIRATTSPWPGTTLNMLKFPLQRTTGRRKFLRRDRLYIAELNKMQQFRSVDPYTTNAQLATLTGEVDRTDPTDAPTSDTETVDPFAQSVRARSGEDGSGGGVGNELVSVGINPNRKEWRDSKWCHDTPGALQPDQLLSLLTHDELRDVLPRSVIVPESYRMRPGLSLFIAGIARIDILHLHHKEPKSIGRIPWNAAIVTVFRSSALPVSVVRTVDAAQFYKAYLGSQLLCVPRGGDQRLELFPALQPQQMEATGVEGGLAAADVVLSSAGWVSLCMSPNTVCTVRAWTPSSRGAYLRDPPFLSHAVKRRGDRVKRSVKYGEHRLYVMPQHTRAEAGPGTGQIYNPRFFAKKIFMR